MGGGGKTSTSTQQVTIPPEVLARYNAVNARAEGLSNTPFQPYSYDPNAFVAPLTQTQQAGIQNINALQGQGSQFYNTAAQMTGAGSQSVNPSELNVGQYFNPFTQYVAGATEAALDQQQGIQNTEQQARAIRGAGAAFGNDRTGLERATLRGQQNLARAQALAPIYQQGYQQAVSTAQQQQGLGLQAEQANLDRLLRGGQQLAGIGSAGQQSGLAAAQAQLGAGTAEQQTQQAGLQALVNQFMQERGYPFQIAQFLANIAMGTGALSGSTTTTTQPAPFFSDEREKTNIKSLGDGLYAYDYIDDVERAERTGSPMPPKRVGPMAQDIEQSSPGQVIDVNDYKVVAPAQKAGGGGLSIAAPTAVRSGLGSMPQFAMPQFGGTSSAAMPRIQASAVLPATYRPPVAEPAPTRTSYRDMVASGQLGPFIPGMIGIMDGIAGMAGRPEMFSSAFGEKLADRMGGSSRAQRNYNPGVAAPRYAEGGYVDRPGAYERGGYAPGGLVGAEDLRSILAAQQQFLGPYAGQGAPYSGQQQGKPSYVPQASLPVPKLMTAGNAPQQRPSGLAEAAQTGSQIAGLLDMGSKAYDKGSQFLSRKPSAPTSTGPKVINESGAIALGMNAPRETPDVAAGLGSAPVKVSDLVEETTAFAANGGRIGRGYASGGMPYGGGDEILQDVLDDGKDEIRQLQKPGQAPGAPKGLGSELMDAAKLGSSLYSIGSTAAAAAPAAMEFLAAIPLMFSDRRLKDNIAPVGETYDGQQIYRYDMGDGRTQLGLMAQEVAQRKPDAVGERNGFLTLDYDRATEDAVPRAYGGLVPRGGYANGGPPENEEPSILERLKRGASDLLPEPDRVLPLKTGTGEKFGGYGDFLTSKQFIIPLLTGLGAMAASPSRYFGGAALQGLGAGAQAYSNLEKREQDMATDRAREQQILAEVGGGERRPGPDGFPQRRVYRGRTPVWIDEGEFQRARREGRPYSTTPETAVTPPAAPYGGPGAEPGFGQRRPNPPEPVGAGSAAGAGTAAGTAATAPARAGTNPATGKPAGAAPRDPSEYPAATGATIQLNPELRKLAEENATMREDAGIAGLPKSEYSPFESWSAAANMSREQMRDRMTFAKALAEIPRDNSAVQSGRFSSEVATPIIQWARSTLSTLGVDNDTLNKIARPQDLANTEVVNKIRQVMAAKIAAGGDQRSLGALEGALLSIPGQVNTPAGAAKLVAEMLVGGQEPLDREAYGTAYRRYVENKFGLSDTQSQWTGRGLAQQYDKDRREALEKDKKYLDELYRTPITIDGKKEYMLPYLIRNNGKIENPQIREAFYKRYGKDAEKVLRYFNPNLMRVQ